MQTKFHVGRHHFMIPKSADNILRSNEVALRYTNMPITVQQDDIALYYWYHTVYRTATIHLVKSLIEINKETKDMA